MTPSEFKSQIDYVTEQWLDGQITDLEYLALITRAMLQLAGQQPGV